MHHLVPDIVTLLRRPLGTQVKRGLYVEEHVEEYDRFNKETVRQAGKQDFYCIRMHGQQTIKIEERAE